MTKDDEEEEEEVRRGRRKEAGLEAIMHPRTKLLTPHNLNSLNQHTAKPQSQK